MRPVTRGLATRAGSRTDRAAEKEEITRRDPPEREAVAVARPEGTENPPREDEERIERGTSNRREEDEPLVVAPLRVIRVVVAPADRIEPAPLEARVEPMGTRAVLKVRVDVVPPGVKRIEERGGLREVVPLGIVADPRIDRTVEPVAIFRREPLRRELEPRGAKLPRPVAEREIVRGDLEELEREIDRLALGREIDGRERENDRLARGRETDGRERENDRLALGRETDGREREIDGRERENDRLALGREIDGRERENDRLEPERTERLELERCAPEERRI